MPRNDDVACKGAGLESGISDVGLERWWRYPRAASMERVADLGRERYISITTFRRDQSPVATPVWVVADSGRLYVWTGAQTGKAKRIRHNPAVTVAPCTGRGALTGSAAPARAQIVPSASRPQVWPLFLAKYGLQLRAIIWSRRISGLLRRGRPPAEQVFLEVTLTR